MIVINYGSDSISVELNQQVQEETHPGVLYYNINSCNRSITTFASVSVVFNLYVVYLKLISHLVFDK